MTVKLRYLNIPKSVTEGLTQLTDILTEQSSPVVFTSAEHEAGTSTIAITVARTLAEIHGKRTLLADCNLRSKRHNVLYGCAPDQPYQLIDSDIDDLYVTLPYDRNANPHRIVESNEFKVKFEEFCNSFDCVIIDAPPVADGAEVLTLGKRGYPLILVADARRTRAETMVDIKERIERHDGKILGVILNRREFYIPSMIYNRL